MAEELQILYMIARLLRLAVDRWSMSRQQVNELFARYGVYGYVQELWGLFHVQGDEAVLNDITSYLESRGCVF